MMSAFLTSGINCWMHCRLVVHSFVYFTSYRDESLGVISALIVVSCVRCIELAPVSNAMYSPGSHTQDVQMYGFVPYKRNSHSCTGTDHSLGPSKQA